MLCFHFNMEKNMDNVTLNSIFNFNVLCSMLHIIIHSLMRAGAEGWTLMGRFNDARENLYIH